MNQPTAFVLTHESDPNRRRSIASFIALSITRSIGRQGFPVVRVHPNRLERSLSSRFCSRVEVCPDFYESESALVEFLIAMKARYTAAGVLIPASDDCAYFLAKYHERLRPHFLVAGPTWAVMQKLLDKKSQYEEAMRLGLSIPETHFPRQLQEVRELAPRLQNYPYVIKPLIAHQWRRASMQGISKGKKGFRVAGAAELIEHYGRIAAGDANVMIQEVIGGRDDRLFTFLSYLDERSQPLAYCVRKKIRQAPIDFGYCTLTVSCHDSTVVDHSLRLLSGIGYHGISGVEWKLDPRTTQYKLIEINARAVNTIGIAPACGVDIPLIAFLDKAVGNVTPVSTWQDGVKWINFTQDIWAARELMGEKLLSVRQWRKSIAGPKTHAVFAWDDPSPSLGYALEFAGNMARGLVARCVPTKS